MRKEVRRNERPVIVNVQPIMKEIELKGIVYRNKEVDALKKAFPNNPRMWVVDQFWADANTYMDCIYFECDRAEYVEKQKVMKANGLDYRFE